MNGNFYSDEVDIECLELDLCTVHVKKSGPISGASAKRLQSISFLSEQGGGFTAQSKTRRVGLACSQTCTVTIK
jgi:hypothetical protein